MADGLVITGGGSISVATDDQIDRVQRIEALREAAGSAHAQLAIVTDLLTEAELRAANAPISALDAIRDIDEAITHLGRAGYMADLLARATRLSMFLYGVGERAQQAAMQSVADQVGYALGRGFAAFAVLAVGGSVPVVVGAGIGLAASGGSVDDLKAAAKLWLAEHPGLINSERTVLLEKLITGAVDDFLLGLTGVDKELDQYLGDSGIGVSGVDTAAAAIVGLGAIFGVFRESVVSVNQVGESGKLLSAPSTFAERMARIPTPDTDYGGGQIRVDKYTTNGTNARFEVYLSGTQFWSPTKNPSPFDLTSDVRGVANLPNGSLAAVEAALRKAGVTKNTPITFTGHSQGGLLAHELAATGRYNVKGLLEAGPPASQSKLKPGTPEVVLQHTNDIVTGLGSFRTDDSAIVASRDPFDGGPVPQGSSVAAHDRELYRETAALLDASSDDAVTSAKQRMNDLSKGATEMSSSYYVAKRIEEG